MMKFTFALAFILYSSWVGAQEPVPVQGVVSDGLEPLEGVHIENVSTSKYSVSNAEGGFGITLSKGDTLVFSHIRMQDLIKIVGEREISKGSLNAVMLERNNELDEVLLEEHDYALELGIISERKEKLTTNERRLQTAGDFKPIHLLGILGGGLPLDPILNAINGRTKQLKRNVQIERKIKAMNFIRTHYLDYLLEMFESTEEDIEVFLDHLVEQDGLQAVMQTKNPDQMKFYLIEEWYKFQER